MATYTATGIGLSTGASASANRSAFQAWATGTAASGDVLEVNGMFPINGATTLPTLPPLTIRAATPGSSNQGFDFPNTVATEAKQYGFILGPNSLIQGLKFTASNAPPVDENYSGNNPLASNGDYHGLLMLVPGSNSTFEYCEWIGNVGGHVWGSNPCDNMNFSFCKWRGGKYQVNFFELTDSLFFKCYWEYALIDGFKINLSYGRVSNNVTWDQCFFRKGRDAIDLAGNWTNLYVNDSIFYQQRVASFDTKTDAGEVAQGPLNRYLTVSRCRFVDIRRSVATDCYDKDRGTLGDGSRIPLADFLATMPRDFLFQDCTYELTAGTTQTQRPGNWLNKGGDYFTILRPQYYGAVTQGIQNSNGFAMWPTGWSPTNLDDGSATKQVFAARAAPTMDLLVGPENWGGGEGTPSNVAPTLSNVAISPSSGSVGDTLVVSYTLNPDVFPSPSISIVWKRGGSPISGAEASSYLTTGSDEDQTISAEVTASNVEGTTTAVAIGVNIIAASAQPEIPVNTSPPTITGTGVAGTLHSVNFGSWTNSPTGYNYGMNFDGVYQATVLEFTPTEADVGKVLTWGVRATNAAGNSVWVDTEPLVITTAVVGTPTLPASSIPITATVV